MKRTFLASVAILSTLVAAGCSAPSTVGREPSAADAAGFSNLFLEGYHADYEPVATTSDLAKLSAAVVSGTATKVMPGRQFGRGLDDPALSKSIVLKIDNVRLLAGEMLSGSRSSIFLELPAPYNEGAQVFDSLLPRDAPVIVYLEPALSAQQTDIVDENAGRPSGDPLWQLVSPQGFFMASDSGATVIMLGAAVAESLEQLGPEDDTPIPSE